MTTGRRSAAAALLAVCTAAAAAIAATAPAAGRYDGELCVSTGGTAPSCGTAEVDLRRGGQLEVRISDIVYRLQLHGNQVDVVLMHGPMQVDGFRTDYAWVGRSLQFVDAERNARYELRLAEVQGRTGGSR